MPFLGLSLSCLPLGAGPAPWWVPAEGAGIPARAHPWAAQGLGKGWRSGTLAMGEKGKFLLDLSGGESGDLC